MRVQQYTAETEIEKRERKKKRSYVVLREKCSTRETSAIVEYEERCTLKIHTYHFGTQST